MPSVWECERRLREHGFTPTRGGYDPDFGTALDFVGPKDIDLDFLRPDFLPPKPSAA